jgi:hypothetical protein
MQQQQQQVFHHARYSVILTRIATAASILTRAKIYILLLLFADKVLCFNWKISPIFLFSLSLIPTRSASS